MNRPCYYVLIVSIAIASLSRPVVAQNEAISDQQRIFFEKKIRPVLVEHCYECHSQDSKTLQGGLLLDSRKGLLAGGDSGEAVVVGHASDSLLMASLEYTDDSYQMPPKGKLSDEVIADFRHWIDIGMPDPRTGETSRLLQAKEAIAGRDFWSFQPVVRPENPPSQSDWAKTFVDRFVERKFSAAGLAPAVDADHRTLVRRVYFDLTGIPPSIEQIDAFLDIASASGTDEAVRSLVDELLESDRFGERWARHWLDVVRYAESSGGGRTLIFPNAWRYRDYVIKSLNDDKPYDTFIREQIAGDLLTAESNQERSQQLIATSFLALGPTNYELQDKDLLRMEVVDEQLDTIGRSMLGLTVGCARCHDHKFDPIPTTDYYGLAGIFRSTKTFTLGNVANFIERPLPSEEFERVKTIHDAALATATSELETTKTELDRIKSQVADAIGDVDFAAWQAARIDTDRAEVIGDWIESKYTPGFVGDNYLHDRNSKKGKKRVAYALDLPPHRFELQAAYTSGPNRATNAVYRVHHANGRTDVVVNQQESPTIEEQFISLGAFQFSDERKGKVELLTENTDGHVIADAIRWLPVSTEQIDPGHKEAVLRMRFVRTSSALSRLTQKMAELKKQEPRNPTRAMSVLEEDAPGDWHVHIRGQVRNLGPIVPRRFISVISSGAPAIPADQSGRLQLANWISSPKNSLTPRVMVNRIWHHLMGDGIVRTPDNFGSMGRRPTHPDLLDCLAAEFVDSGWSIKETIRLIMNSRVYRLGEQSDRDVVKADPDNQMFSYRKPRRLDAESLRDSMLAVSGELELTMFGYTQEKGTKSEVDYKFVSNRRSIYVPWFRNTQLDALQIFDAANPNVVTGRRTVTSMPTQALFLMNSDFVRVAAKNLADRVLADATSDEARIDRVYLIAIGRPARESERSILLDFMTRQRSQEVPESEFWSRMCHLVLASVDFRSI